ncbi:MAG: hypothetical protein AAF483_18455 [Planctomycetota bacterium]
MFARPSKQTILFICALALVGAFLFSPGLFFSKIPAFRDTYHFYYPQMVWLDACAQRGELFPQWNHWEGLGNSTPGQVSTGLYYPFRVLFFLPIFSLEQRLGLFLLTHFLNCGLGMYWAAKRLELSTAASQLAALAYALCCPVLFQQNNLIYFCSASWIGFFLAAWLSLLREKGPAWCWTLLLSLALSLMLLSGDPHTAFNACILACISLPVLAWRRREAASTLRCTAFFSTALGLMLVLTAIQWMPAWRQAQLSSRAAYLPETVMSTEASLDQRACMEVAESFQLSRQRIYDFSEAPWHFASCAWPMIAGHYQPQHSRWMDAIPAEGRMWTPSLYFGLLPLGLLCWGIINGQRNHRWLLWLLAFTFLLSIGNYSPIWAFRQLLLALGLFESANKLPTDESLCLYGLLANWIPQYDGFRYPAKWTVWFCATSSLIAACNFQAFIEQKPRSNYWKRIKLAFCILSGVVVLTGVSIWLTPLGDYLEAQVRDDPWLGELNARAAAHSIVLSGLLPLSALFLLNRLPPSWPKAQVFVYGTLIEMCLVACCWMHFVDPPDLASVVRATPAEANLWTNILKPKHKGSELSALQIQQQFLLGKLASSSPHRSLSAIQSIDPLWVEKLKIWLSLRDTMQPEQFELDAVLASLAVTHRLVIDSQESEVSYRWHEIEEPSALCELWTIDGTARIDLPLEFEWQSESCLVLNGSAPARSKLVVRQFNDGGWTVDQEQLSVNPVLESPSLFIEFEIPAGQFNVQIHRKWLW